MEEYGIWDRWESGVFVFVFVLGRERYGARAIEKYTSFLLGVCRSGVNRSLTHRHSVYPASPHRLHSVSGAKSRPFQGENREV